MALLWCRGTSMTHYAVVSKPLTRKFSGKAVALNLTRSMDKKPLMRALSGNDDLGRAGEEHPIDSEDEPSTSNQEVTPVSSSSSSMVPDSLPLLGADTDWRTFRARLVAQERMSSEDTSALTTDIDDVNPQGLMEHGSLWAHSIALPERGALLLAHPLMFEQSQQYFHQAVILLLDHDETGSIGVILNRPSDYNLGKLVLSEPQMGQFDSCRLYVGGDVGDNRMQMLHSIQELQGCKEVVKGVYMGGIEGARSKVVAGEATADDFRWYAGYAGWGPGQLQSECKRGVWFTAAGSPDLILQRPDGSKRDPSSGKDYWHQVLQLMGGDYKKLSDTITARVTEKKTSEGDKKSEDE
ncbi:hypothetical protein CEUSTIGMA_g7185.t1 [Chlamydomonas eustigma]|uniref:YqgE/AlgH family protein n=1 Tax=Chlamydomonas eustigma TaxID=1157962 RepID=A0A250X9J3_9CHLO|nr:hypothetical protein CEUSTIGMA_g7185.t1 [Chlamydomonas eustigma]|eukprot:GAX79744.1 hypothetical protein CEUSTIGMA_g7185.t1 [Chlamydomonas eustigma]